ncbi:Uncharacterised protein [uncultured archaeon]|nr:Uncharacterised protein [uncultured archaeon]
MKKLLLILLFATLTGAAPIDNSFHFNILVTGSDTFAPVMTDVLTSAGHTLTYFPYATFANNNTNWTNNLTNWADLIVDVSYYAPGESFCPGDVPCRPIETQALRTAMSNYSIPVMSTKVLGGKGSLLDITYTSEVSAAVSTVTAAVNNYVTSFMGATEVLFKDLGGDQQTVQSVSGGIGTTFVIPTGNAQSSVLANEQDSTLLTGETTTARSATYGVWANAGDPGYNITPSGATLFNNMVHWLMQTKVITTVEDHTLAGIPATMALYYANGTFADNDTSATGNLDPEVYKFLNYSTTFSTYNTTLQVNIDSINPITERNRTFGMDKILNHLGYLGVYGIQNNYTFNNATIYINYSDLTYSNEATLTLSKCDNYNFTAQTCNGAWTDITASATKDTANKRFIYQTTSFSGFGIGGGGNGPTSGGGGGGAGGFYNILSIEAKPTCAGKNFTATVKNKYSMTPTTGIIVELISNGATISTGIPDASGTITLEAPLPGTYTIKAIKAYFITVTMNIEVPECLQCTTNADCASDRQCTNNLCIPVLCLCGKTEAHKCQPYECCSNKECESGICTDHKCTECSKNEDCPETKQCKDNKCTPIPCDCGTITKHTCNPYECCLDSDCRSNVCRNHKCSYLPTFIPEIKQKPEIKGIIAALAFIFTAVVLLHYSGFVKIIKKALK